MAMLSTRELLELDVQTRLELIDQLWESVVNDLNDSSKPNSLPISDATRALLEERRREYRADPSAAVPWEDVHTRLRQLIGATRPCSRSV
jgi:putative addiction module component (TIGR02574 family)